MYIPKTLVLSNFLSHSLTTFEFREGKAVLVIGENLDNEGQKGNGAGKSALNEGISLAIIGNTIRKVDTRELIKDEEEVAEIALVLYNSKTEKNFVINREIYSSKNKSSVCKLYMDSEEITSCPDINSYNKYILEEIGISKEDFLNFYLVTKEKYLPFFAIGDTKKKEIINNFSGASTVDSTFELIDQDISEKDNEVRLVELELAGLEATATVLSEDIDEQTDIESKAEERDIEGEIQKVDEKIAVAKVSRNTLKTLKKSNETDKGRKQEELDEYVFTPVDAEIKVFQDNIDILKKSIETQRLTYKNVKSEFSEEYAEIKAGTDDVDTVVTEAGKEVTKLTKQRNILFNKLQGLIECPKCHHKFSLAEQELDIEKTRKEVEQYDKDIVEQNTLIQETNDLLPYFEEEKDKVDKKVTDREEEIEKEGKKFKTSIETDQKKIDTLEEKRTKEKKEYGVIKTAIANFGTEIESLGSQVEQKDTLLDNYEKQKITLKEGTESKLPALNKKLEECMNTQVEVKKRKEKFEEELIGIRLWTTVFKKFKSHLANQSIKNISDYTNLFLSSIRSNITIEVEGYRELSDGRLKEEINTQVQRNGFDVGSYGKFSAGERGRIDVCCILALQELINLSNPTGGLDLLICDEVLDSVDSYGLELLTKSLQDLGKTIMIVSQNQINTYGEDVIVVQKSEGVSTILG